MRRDGKTDRHDGDTARLFLSRDFAKERVQDQAIWLSLTEDQTVTEVKDLVTNKSPIDITTLLRREQTHLLLRHKPSILMAEVG